MDIKNTCTVFLLFISLLAGCASKGNQRELPGKNVSYFITSSTQVKESSKQALIQRGMGVAVNSSKDECLILTTKHTVTKADTIWVQPWSGFSPEGENGETSIKARVVKEAPDSDIALLSFPFAGGCQYTGLASEEADLGSKITVFGQPLDSTGFVSKGIISGLWETEMGPLIVSDALTTRGFSGSGAFNHDNKLVGLVTGKTADNRRGFAYIFPLSGLRSMVSTEKEINETK